jgi:3-hydroxy-9,10-secoandrosta-1,3,5(10)-triene-9,17-dione monooxygenase reductase component
MTTVTPNIPEGMSADAASNWPSRTLIESYLGDLDFELRPGEDVILPSDDPEAMAAARKFRDVLGRYASGVTVITTVSNGEPIGMTCQSFMSVSLTPPLVMFSPAKTSRAWPRIQASGRFAVNFLGEGQQELSNTMASRGTDKFAGVEWTPAPATGSPLFAGTVGYVDCGIHAVYEAGDHFLVLGLVEDLQVNDADAPLLYFQGKYRGLA